VYHELVDAGERRAAEVQGRRTGLGVVEDGDRVRRSVGAENSLGRGSGRHHEGVAAAAANVEVAAAVAAEQGVGSGAAVERVVAVENAIGFLGDDLLEVVGKCCYACKRTLQNISPIENIYLRRG